jgi:hypothetical protein
LTVVCVCTFTINFFLTTDLFVQWIRENEKERCMYKYVCCLISKHQLHTKSWRHSKTEPCKVAGLSAAHSAWKISGAP